MRIRHLDSFDFRQTAIAKAVSLSVSRVSRVITAHEVKGELSTATQICRRVTPSQQPKS
jgi:hypothetical protein